MCGQGYCGCYNEEEISDDDQMAYLEEKEKILEAKLATVRHMKATLGKKSESDKK